MDIKYYLLSTVVQVRLFVDFWTAENVRAPTSTLFKDEVYIISIQTPKICCEFSINATFFLLTEHVKLANNGPFDRRTHRDNSWTWTGRDAAWTPGSVFIYTVWAINKYISTSFLPLFFILSSSANHYASAEPMDFVEQILIKLFIYIYRDPQKYLSELCTPKG